MRRVGPGCLFWIVLSIVLSVALTIVLNLGLFALGGQGMFRWGAGNRRGCCTVVPIEWLLSVLLVLLVSGLALAQLL